MTLLQLSLALALAAGAEKPVATVDGRAITPERLVAYAAESSAAGRALPPERLVDELVQQELAAGEAARVGVADDPAVKAQVEARARTLAAQRLVEVELGAGIKPDEAIIRELYHARADAARYRIVVKATRAEAQAVLERLQAGGKKFAEEAKGSLDPASAGKGSEIELTRSGMQPRLAEVVFTAPLYALAGPVELELGWAVLEVLERQVGDEAGLAAARPGITAMAAQVMRRQAKEHYLKHLRQAAHAELDVKFLEATGARLDATPQELDHVLARVGSRELRYRAVLEETVRLARGKASRHFSGPSVKLELATGQLDALLLEDAAEKRGLLREPSVVAAAALYRRQVSAQAWVAREAAKAPRPTDAEAEAWYAQRGQDWWRPGRRACAHILLASEREARDVKARLARGASFDAVSALSRDPSTSGQGGSLGELADDRVDELAKVEPQLARAVREARADEVSGPVKSGAGWHLLRCGPHQPAGAPPFAAVKGEVVERMVRERREARVNDEIAQLRRAATVSIDRAAIAQLGERAPAR